MTAGELAAVVMAAAPHCRCREQEMRLENGRRSCAEQWNKKSNGSGREMRW